MLKCRFKSSPLLILEVSSSSFCAILTFFLIIETSAHKKQKNEIRKIVFELRKQARFGSVCQPFKLSLKPKVTIV